MATGIIGIDCATQPKNIGLAFGHLENINIQIDQVSIGSNESDMVGTITGWTKRHQTTLIALDAPLGWPDDLVKELFTHKAGQAIKINPNQLFRRETDRFIKAKLGKQPLDVGADRIARTAHNALALLEDIGRRADYPIPLAWEKELPRGISAIEVYPAATLLVHGIKVAGYKQKEGIEARLEITNKLMKFIDIPIDKGDIEKYDHVLDAIICVLAGFDFLNGEVYQPIDKEKAQKEGWIWVGKPT